MILALVVIAAYFYIGKKLYKKDMSLLDTLLVTAFMAGLGLFILKEMTWVPEKFSRTFDSDTQECAGWDVTEDKCLGAVVGRE